MSDLFTDFNGQAAIKHSSNVCNSLREFENCRHGVIEDRPLTIAHFATNNGSLKNADMG